MGLRTCHRRSVCKSAAVGRLCGDRGGGVGLEPQNARIKTRGYRGAPTRQIDKMSQMREQVANIAGHFMETTWGMVCAGSANRLREKEKENTRARARANSDCRVCATRRRSNFSMRSAACGEADGLCCGYGRQVKRVRCVYEKKKRKHNSNCLSTCLPLRGG